MRCARRCGWLVLAFVLVISKWGAGLPPAAAQQPVIPHAQDKPPGPALSPADAIKAMTVPKGFTVEAVAHEPDIVNPVAMTIDERGRFWITESLEYPRRVAGPGKDRVKILEDTDGDGKADKFTVFADDLNIPSGIAVGHGGVWVANSPDILFMQDTDGDGRFDRREVVVTGFGRDDTHELPNSLTWGPDGWLYGLNGVFNASHVRYPEKSPHFKPDHPGWKFTCALFRIHPKTREFQVFCEGTSNPWGVAFDRDGSAFVSACVIDHLWHLVQTGYYHRQGGPYPPFTWKIDSIVKHKHQKAAYCGIHYFDSDVYPEQYRGRLYMGNIHGGCVNVDSLKRDGATYFASGEPDFITANDAWFMPVVQKTGPDGCLYVLDWYDRYHCYQDANRDPAGIDRLKGRLYRIRYQDSPRAPQMDLAKETTERLIILLGTNNDFIQSTAQRILTERILNEPADVVAGIQKKLFEIVKAAPNEASLKAQRRALFLICSQDRIESDLHWQLLDHQDPIVRAWAVRATIGLKQLDDLVRAKAADLAKDTSRDVQLQVAIAAKRLDPEHSGSLLLDVLANCGDDKLIPHIVWQNLHPLLEESAPAFAEHVAGRAPRDKENLSQILPRIVDRILVRKQFDARPIVALLDLNRESARSNSTATIECLALLTSRIQSGELKGANLDALKQSMQSVVEPLFGEIKNEATLRPSDDLTSPLYLELALLTTSWKDPAGLPIIRRAFLNGATEARRLQALDVLVAAKSPDLLNDAVRILSPKIPQSGARDLTPEERRSLRTKRIELAPIAFRGQVLAALGRLTEPRVADTLLELYPEFDPELQPRLIELLTQRADWSKALLAAIDKKVVPANALNLNQVRKLLATKDPELTKLVATHWGTIRDDRNPQRELVIAEMRKTLRTNDGNPHEGKKIFAKVCGQCHKMYGEGAEVGPDITLNGRSSFEQLLSNVFDPSLVIGASYQARTIQTTDGRVLTGLLAEDNDQRIVLKVQGGKLETIPRDQIEASKVSALSMMPEDLEKQLKPNELVDLFAYITLDKPPTDPSAKRLPGSTAIVPRETTDRSQFSELVGEVAPGFDIPEVGEGGVAILAEHAGRPGVLRTHPVSRDKPCILTRTVTLPAGKKSRLLVDVSPDPRGDWRLLVIGNGERLLDEMINKTSAKTGWAAYEVDLSKFAGKEVKLRLVNQANDWSYEFGYWGRVELVSE